MRDVIFPSLTQIDRNCVCATISRGDTDALKRQFVSFLLRAHFGCENFKSRQPTLMLATENVEKIAPVFARNLLRRHSYFLLKLQSERFPVARRFPRTRNAPAVPAHASRQNESRRQTD